MTVVTRRFDDSSSALLAGNLRPRADHIAGSVAFQFGRKGASRERASHPGCGAGGYYDAFVISPQGKITFVQFFRDGGAEVNTPATSINNFGVITGSRNRRVIPERLTRPSSRNHARSGAKPGISRSSSYRLRRTVNTGHLAFAATRYAVPPPQ